MGLVVESAGAFSVVFGFLYGSVFGMESLIEPLWFSPMENMDFLLRFSLAAGAFFITLGMVLNIYQSWKEGDYGRMLFDGQGIAGVVFYWTAGLAIFARLSGRDLPVPGWALAALLGLLLAAMLLKGLLTRKLLKAPSAGEGGVVQLFEVLHVLFSFMSNTASFIRLAAFTVNHVGLSLAVFMLADLVREIPGGLFLRLVIIAVGTLLIVGLEGLIVFIQTLRLEYYEFFSKFYRGGGDPFRPVRWREGAPAGKMSWEEWQ
jgi:V/A-type H+-transporting ATPase subunit I